MRVTAFNSTVGPVVVSERGNTLGGGEWGPVDTLDEVAAAGFDSGDLIRVDRPKGTDLDLEPAAVAALDLTDRYAERSDRLEELDKAALVKIARAADLIDKDGDPPLRDDLERMIIEGDFDLPAPKAAKQPQTQNPTK